MRQVYQWQKSSNYKPRAHAGRRWASAGAAMAAAGIAWGIYSLLGRQSRDPLATTAANFILGVPLVLAVLLGQCLLAPALLHAGASGIALAIASGAIASGSPHYV